MKNIDEKEGNMHEIKLDMLLNMYVGIVRFSPRDKLPLGRLKEEEEEECEEH